MTVRFFCLCCFSERENDVVVGKMDLIYKDDEIGNLKFKIYNKDELIGIIGPGIEEQQQQLQYP